MHVIKSKLAHCRRTATPNILLSHNATSPLVGRGKTKAKLAEPPAIGGTWPKEELAGRRRSSPAEGGACPPKEGINQSPINQSPIPN
ncbi:MAG TPA: hypothetical protein VKX40_16585 [Aequorivita sp.]|nr:hypothetical protein [Aequorivita sp.]